MKKLQAIFEQRVLDKKDIVYLLSLDNETEQKLLFQKANELTGSVFGKGVFLRGIIEFSNVCMRDCHYCGIRVSNQTIQRYRMPVEEIVEIAVRIRTADIFTVVLQSGEDPAYTPEVIEKLIRDIKANADIAITLSVGETDRDTYLRWRKAGADRFLLKFETSNPELYTRLHPDCDFDERWRCLKDIRETGYQLGSGFMTGLPGQTVDMLADDLLALAGLEPDMAGIGPFISHPQTPLHNAAGGDPLMTLKVLAVARLLLKDTYLPTTTALETLEHNSRIRGLTSGANVIMPNFTPLKYKQHYEIYPNKAGTRSDVGDILQTIREQIRAAGKHIESGYGHSVRKRFKGSKG
ncbi:MAG: [FeFe] hydrogenase H-cluster radical SAM maturase HydE [FCB group bacterium]|nr:[FeFe] hydrogenase H-cluster radical SAM maturase HydE [FCB group bacterium]